MNRIKLRLLSSHTYNVFNLFRPLNISVLSPPLNLLLFKSLVEIVPLEHECYGVLKQLT